MAKQITISAKSKSHKRLGDMVAGLELKQEYGSCQSAKEIVAKLRTEKYKRF